MAGLFSFLEDIGTIKNYPVTANLDMNEFLDIYAPTSAYTPTYTMPNMTLTPSLQYNPQFLINSAGASATGGSITPTVTPSQVISPTVTQTPTITPTQSQSATQDLKGGAGGGMDWTTIAIVGVVVVGAYLIFGRGKQGKENREKVKRTAKKGVKYGVKAAKYAAMVV